jgi:atypical dual specificity phosphatase
MKMPRFPQTAHLHNHGAAAIDDVISTPVEMTVAFLQASTIDITEKVDGSSVRVLYDGKGDLLLGNREHILKKGYLKDTPAKLQFRPLWGWVYEHRKNFAKLTKALGETPIVYAEWMLAFHTIRYTRLPDYFIPFDLMLEGKFMDPTLAREALLEAGFTPPPGLPSDAVVQGPSRWSDEPREGIYFKLGDGVNLLSRFKEVRPDFRPRKDFNETKLSFNQLMEP